LTSSQKQSPSEIGMDGSFAEAFVRSRRFFTRGTISDDLRTLSQVGGREADDFYRDRWSHDKVCGPPTV
jgi:nitrate reductase / nitrite oxidoreductase, alpha subunit